MQSRTVPNMKLTLTPARIYTVAVALAAVASFYLPDLPTPLLLGVVAAVMGLGEVTARAEESRVAVALSTPVPDDE